VPLSVDVMVSVPDRFGVDAVAVSSTTW